ncbi:MAG: heavy metal translocating P-type ATPase [Desulfuromonadales bacterium]|nr:heavy metal translocating P-type ATPase [Desulfuromonadales bacterium]
MEQGGKYPAKSRKFTLTGLTCTTCAAGIETALRQQEHIAAVQINFNQASMEVDSDLPQPELLALLQRIGESVETGLIVSPWGEPVGLRESGYLWQWLRLGLGSLLLLAGFLLAGKYPESAASTVAYLTSYLLVGGTVILAAVRNLRNRFWFDEHLLMSIATGGALAIGEYPEAVAVMLFYLAGEILQGRAVDRSRRAIGALLDIRPEQATLLQDGRLLTVQPEQVKVGEQIVVRPGERVPLDGEIVVGESLLDTSALTGESVPRRLAAGDELLAGMINGEGVLTVRVIRPFEQSALVRILELVEHASGNKAETERFITRFARIYTPLVVVAAALIAVMPPLLAGGDWHVWCYRALIFLVVSCPCALMVSIPLGFFGGIGRASHQGILVKGGNFLETLARTSTVVFDKTGTLTRGVFEVRAVVPAAGWAEAQLLELGALAEMHSNHPVGKSIRSAWHGPFDPAHVQESRELPGLGVVANINGQQVLVGNRRLLSREGIEVAPAQGSGTIVHLAVDGDYAGYLVISDVVREDAAETIARLRKLGIRRMIMLSGDRQEVVQEVAEMLGLDGYHGELLPEQKLEKVEELLAGRHPGKLAVVGDGINDAPVLARADVGVAMGGLGSDAAIEAADVVLMTDEPAKLATAIETARLTERIVWQNIALAFTAKGAVLLLGLLGLASMWQAIFADVGVALLAVMNSIRIIR